MLIIRPEQKNTLKKGAKHRFESDMLTHLNQFSPDLFKTVKEEQMLKVIRLGMSQAETYGFTFRGPVRLYLELMLLFGSGFDTDPQYPWAAEILNAKDSALQMQRADLLYEKTLDYRHEVSGPDDAYMYQALQRFADRAEQPLTFNSNDIVPDMLSEIKVIYPEKTAYVREAGLMALILEGVNTAHHYLITTDRGIGLIIFLMVAFGHNCTQDPLYPWIENTLADKENVDSKTREEQLEKKALIWLDHTVKNFKSNKQQ